MCIISVSAKGIRQPSEEELRIMFEANPDGAGYMTVKNGLVHIHKGFMNISDFLKAVKSENFGVNDPVVYHFRICTQARRQEMTHPFPLSSKKETMEWLDLTCGIGLAHNGIIRMTSDYKETRYNDTSIFIADYMTRLIRDEQDAHDSNIATMIENLTNSKWAILTSDGVISTVGHFENENGLLFSNKSYIKKQVFSVPYSKVNYSGYCKSNYKQLELTDEYEDMFTR